MRWWFWRRRALRDLNAYLDRYEASFGFGDRPLPEHWGITQQVATLRALAQGRQVSGG